MTATTRIRWEDAPSFDPADYLGYAGTADAVMFRIFNHEPLRNEWVLTTDLPGMQQARHFAEGSSAPAELKGAAEEWLNRFIASLGAVFPDQFLAESATRHRFLARVDALEDADQAAGALTDLACMDESDGINDDQRAALREMILARFPEAEN